MRPERRTSEEPNASSGNRPNLARLAVRGVLWNYASVVTTKGGSLLTTVVLARLLTPADFGLITFAVIAIDLLGLLQDLGLGAALIRHRAAAAAADTVFTLNLLLATMLMILAVLFAPYASAWAGEPSVASLLRVLGATFLLDALGAIHFVRLRSAMDFRRKLGADAARATAKAAVAIGCGLAGAGVWSLVAGQIAGALVGTIAVWRLSPWIPRLRIDLPLSCKLLRFGSPFMMCNVLTVLGANLALLAVGRSGAAALGAYSIAEKLPTLVIGNLMWVAADVLFPAYARLERGSERLRSALLDTVRVSAVVYVPLGLGIALSADVLVPAVLGAGWESAVGPLRLLALSALVSSLTFHFGDMLKGIGRANLVLKVDSLEFLILVPATLTGAVFMGPAGVAWARLVTETISGVVRLRVSLPLADVSARQYLRALGPAAAGACGLVVTVMTTLQVAKLGAVWRFGLIVTLGVLGYGTAVWLADQRLVRSLMKLIFAPMGRASDDSGETTTHKRPWTL
jgi:lipopolysaccharide exporter